MRVGPGAHGTRREQVGECELCRIEAPLQWVNVDPALIGLEPTPLGEPDVAELRLCPDCAHDAEDQMRRRGDEADFDFTGGVL